MTPRTLILSLLLRLLKIHTWTAPCCPQPSNNNSRDGLITAPVAGLGDAGGSVKDPSFASIPE